MMKAWGESNPDLMEGFNKLVKAGAMQVDVKVANLLGPKPTVLLIARSAQGEEVLVEQELVRRSVS
jgi:hypothetical protein